MLRETNEGVGVGGFLEVPLRASTRVHFYGIWSRRIIYIHSNENSAPGAVQSGPDMVLDLRWGMVGNTTGGAIEGSRTKMFSDKEYNAVEKAQSDAFVPFLTHLAV